MKLLIRLMFTIITIFLINTTIYAYTEYKVGDIIPYNGMNFYVIKNSGSIDDSVTMLKAEPLSYEEVQTYSEGTGAQISNKNEYGGIQYGKESNNYQTSYVKNTVDAWARDMIPNGLIEIRLIKYDELINDLGYVRSLESSKSVPSSNGETPKWLYNEQYDYWTMSGYSDSEYNIWRVRYTGMLMYDELYTNYNSVIRPVVKLKKTTLGDEDEGIIDENDNEDIANNNESNTSDYNVSDKKEVINNIENNKVSTTVKVENTYMKKSLIIIVIGFIISCISIIIYYMIKNKIIVSRRWIWKKNLI